MLPSCRYGSQRIGSSCPRTSRRLQIYGTRHRPRRDRRSGPPSAFHFRHANPAAVRSLGSDQERNIAGDYAALWKVFRDDALAARVACACTRWCNAPTRDRCPSGGGAVVSHQPSAPRNPLRHNQRRSHGPDDCCRCRQLDRRVGRGVAVAGLLTGSEKLFAFADRNPGLALRPTTHTHNHRVLADCKRLVAINSPIEVDLTGQVNSESVGGRYVRAVGEAIDYLRGAAASAGGRSRSLRCPRPRGPTVASSQDSPDRRRHHERRTPSWSPSAVSQTSAAQARPSESRKCSPHRPPAMPSDPRGRSKSSHLNRQASVGLSKTRPHCANQ